jgi:hypothetical protein
MLRHVVIGWVCVSMALGGCSPKPVIFNPEKNPDVKRIVLTRYDNVNVVQKYTKDVGEVYRVPRFLNSKRGGNLVGAAVIIPDPTGGFIAGGIAIVALTAAIAEAETNKRRTERLNANGLHLKVPGEVHAAIQSRLTKLGYVVTPSAPLSSKSFVAKTPVRMGQGLPDMKKKRALEQFKLSGKAGELFLVVNTLALGVEQRDRFGKKPTFHPFVVVGVRGYRTDTGAFADQFELISVAPNPLPLNKDLDTAIADTAVLRKAYDDAIGLAVDEIVGDFDRSGGGIQLAKPAAKPVANSANNSAAKPAAKPNTAQLDPKAKPNALPNALSNGSPNAKAK